MLDCGCPADFPDWHDQDINLGGQCAHRLSFPCLLHMPLAYEAYVQRQNQSIDQLELSTQWPGLRLTRTGLLRGELICLLKEGPSLSRHVLTLPQPFNLRGYLHQGSVSTLREPLRHIQMALLDAGRMPRELYLCHLTCPRCNAQRGGDQILILRRWHTSPRLAKRLAKQA